MTITAPAQPARRSMAGQLESLWQDTLLADNARRRAQLLVATVLLVIFIGTVDYLAGLEVSMLAFYCIPVVLGTAALNWKFGVLIAVTCVASWIGGDFLNGARYINWVVMGWNALIVFTTYLVIVWLFATVQTLHREMQDRVRQRTADLTAEIAERSRLEKILLEISERERTSIGRELHDNLGQHLTGTAFAGQVLGEKLRALGLSEQADAWKIVALIEEGIEKTRHLSRGLFLDDFQRTGLVTALRELSAEASAQYRIPCEFRLDGAFVEPGSDAAGHLLRIAQEAVRNAVRHGRAPRIVITLAERPEHVELTVRDYGCGLPAPERRGDGLGLRIMVHRAQIMKGQCQIETHPEGGTLVRCLLPATPLSHDN